MAMSNAKLAGVYTLYLHWRRNRHSAPIPTMKILADELIRQFCAPGFDMQQMFSVGKHYEEMLSKSRMMN